jgi:hypothetical protein
MDRAALNKSCSGEGLVAESHTSSWQSPKETEELVGI